MYIYIAQVLVAQILFVKFVGFFVNILARILYRITGYLCDPAMYAFWPKKAILKCMQILFMRIYFYHIILRCIYINYANYICVILVLLAYSHKYSTHINNQLYGIFILYSDELNLAHQIQLVNFAVFLTQIFYF